MGDYLTKPHQLSWCWYDSVIGLLEVLIAPRRCFPGPRPYPSGFLNCSDVVDEPSLLIRTSSNN
jgi:hypothetical protein